MNAMEIAKALGGKRYGDSWAARCPSHADRNPSLLIMVAVVTDGITGSAMGVHRTFLKADGSGKAPVTPAKMMLGPCRGGAVRLGIPGTSIMVAEGIETALAVMMATGKPAWPALSASGLRTLELGPEINEVIVLADGDDAGLAAAEACACRLHRPGRRIRIARPPPGKDFNDMLLAQLDHPPEDLPNDQ